MAKTKSRPKREAEVPAGIDVGGRLAAARGAIEAGRFAAAVTELVAAWNGAPDEKLAKLAVEVSAKLPREQLPAKIAAREAAWLALAANHDPADLPTLLGADWPTHPREAKARLNELVEFPPDPRIAEAMFGLVAAKRYMSNAGIAFWRLAWVTLGGWGEARVAPFTKEKLSPPRLTPDVAAEIDALSTLVGVGAPKSNNDLPALLAAVYDDPASDGPRLVYADALLEEGDPRGEFIQLQLAAPSAKTTSRWRALARAHGATWLDGVETFGDPVFRRGFIAEVNIGATRADPPRGWRTVELVRLMNTIAIAKTAAFLLHDNLAGVTSVEGVPIKALPALAAKSYDRLRVCEIAPIKAAPKVRELAITSAQSLPLSKVFAWLATAPVSPEHLGVQGDESALGQVWTWLQTAKLSTVTISELAFTQIGWELVLVRRDGRTQLTATWLGRFGGEPDSLGAAISAVPRDGLAGFTATSRVELEPAVENQVTAELAKALKRHPGCTVSLFES